MLDRMNPNNRGKMESPLRRAAAGFTLIEVVIALAILAFAMFGAVSMITYTTRMNMASREQFLAMRAAEKKIEQMLSCTSFDEIFTQFSQQTEGLGWEQVWENDIAGVPRVALVPMTNIPTYDRTAFFVDGSGYVYPIPDPKATLFVRFPVRNTSVPPSWDIPEAQAGGFAGLQTPNTAVPPVLTPTAELDLNSDGDVNDIFSNVIPTPAGRQPMTGTSGIKMLPVVIDVFWKGAAGPGRLSYKYTFLRKN